MGIFKKKKFLPTPVEPDTTPFVKAAEERLAYVEKASAKASADYNASLSGMISAVGGGLGSLIGATSPAVEVALKSGADGVVISPGSTYVGLVGTYKYATTGGTGSIGPSYPAYASGAVSYWTGKYLRESIVVDAICKQHAHEYATKHQKDISIALLAAERFVTDLTLAHGSYSTAHSLITALDKHLQDFPSLQLQDTPKEESWVDYIRKR